MAPRRMLGLAAVGSAAGLFSGLFGVGGGAVVVPLLVLRFAYPDRAAMGTSLLAIAVMAGGAMLTQGAYGNLHVDDGLLVGLPAVGGGVARPWLPERGAGGRGRHVLAAARAGAARPAPVRHGARGRGRRPRAAVIAAIVVGALA